MSYAYLQSVEQAYRMAGVLKGPARGLSVDEKQEGLLIANAMLDGWEIERLAAYVITRTSFPLIPNQQSYTIGPTAANFTLSTPPKLEAAGVIYVGKTQEYPLDLLTEEQWERLSPKSETGTVPLFVHYKLGAPLGAIYAWPIPITAAALILYTWGQLGQITALTDTVNWPKGYREPFEYNLAVAVNDRYSDVPMNPRIAMQARIYKGRLKSLNVPLLEITTGVEFRGVGRTAGQYDPYTNTYR